MLQCSGYTPAMSLPFRDAAGPSLSSGGSVACVGAFDGVHLGHRALLERVASRARAQNLAACAISFAPIPREFFARGAPVPRLASVREKIERIGEAGIDRLLLLRFDAALAAMEAEAFVTRVLRERCGAALAAVEAEAFVTRVSRVRCGAREIWVGADFRFGHARRGDVALLKTLGARDGFTVHTLPDIAVDGERVS